MTTKLGALILAAGKGVRMKSALPKVAHPILGRPMVRYVIDAVRDVGAQWVGVVVGFGKESLISSLEDENLSFIEQNEQLGTGHAVQCFASQCPLPPENLLVVCGDTPLLSRDSLGKMVTIHEQEQPAVTMLTLSMENPGNYGRILRSSDGKIIAIREAKDCTEKEKQIKEINLAVYLFEKNALLKHLPRLKNENKQKEYYLTDLIEMFKANGQKIAAFTELDEKSTLGINSRKDLALVSKIMKTRILEYHMDNGVTIIDPEQTLIEPEVEIGEDTIIWPGTTILSSTRIGKECVIGPHSFLSSADLGDKVTARFCSLEKAIVPAGTFVTPFSIFQKDSPEEKIT